MPSLVDCAAASLGDVANTPTAAAATAGAATIPTHCRRDTTDLSFAMPPLCEHTLAASSTVLLAASLQCVAMSLQPQRTVAELKELRALTGDADGAQRVAFTDTWAKARGWLREKLSSIPADVYQDEAG